MGTRETVISVNIKLWFGKLKEHFDCQKFDLCKSTAEMNQTDTCNESHLGSQDSDELVPQTLFGHVLPEHTQFTTYLQHANTVAGCSLLV